MFSKILQVAALIGHCMLYQSKYRMLEGLTDRLVTIDVLRPLLCTRQAKWAEQPPNVMRRSQRRNNLQLCPPRDSNTGGSDLQSNTLPLDHGDARLIDWYLMSYKLQVIYLQTRSVASRRLDSSSSKPLGIIWPCFWYITFKFDLFVSY